VLDCVLISSDEEFRRLVTDLFREEDAHARLVLDIPKAAHEVPRDALGKILTANPRVVFIDLGDETTGVRVIRALSQEAPDIALAVAGPQLTAEMLLSIMRAGATEYFPRPLAREDAIEAFGRIRRRMGPLAKERSADRGHLTTVFSAKGGTGVTTIAANLSIALRQITGEETLLLDLASSLGTAALVVGLHPRYSYLDVVQNFHRIDEELLRSFLEVHECGLAVLASPPLADQPTGLTTDETLGLIRLCRRHFRHVVVDGGSGATDAVGAALMESDHRVVVTTPELPTLRNLKRLMSLMYGYSGNGSKPPRVIVNQYRDDAGVTRRDVEDGLGYEVSAIIERDDTIAQSINLGEPVVLGGRSRFSREIMRIGADIAGPDYEVQSRNGIMGRMLRPFRGSKSTSTETTETKETTSHE
jgi:pilus assembly protein CpaE